jgi:hypothetical protein
VAAAGPVSCHNLRAIKHGKVVPRVPAAAAAGQLQQNSRRNITARTHTRTHMIQGTPAAGGYCWPRQATRPLRHQTWQSSRAGSCIPEIGRKIS